MCEAINMPSGWSPRLLGPSHPTSMGSISSTDPLRVSPAVCVGAQTLRATPWLETNSCSWRCEKMAGKYVMNMKCHEQLITIMND